MALSLRFYLDENVQVMIAEQLRVRGIESVTARDLGKRGDSDPKHLQHATQMGYVLCTHDADLVELAASGVEHSSIVFGQHDQHSIGDWVKGLELMHAVYTPEEMMNRVEYL